jgi:hypothetical protein
MTISERIIYGCLVALIMGGGYVVTVTSMHVDHKVTPSMSNPKYTEEPFTKLDGTPCTIIRDRYPAYIGVTCNYAATPINERK